MSVFRCRLQLLDVTQAWLSSLADAIISPIRNNAETYYATLLEPFEFHKNRGYQRPVASQQSLNRNLRQLDAIPERLLVGYKALMNMHPDLLVYRDRVGQALAVNFQADCCHAAIPISGKAVI